MKLGIIASLVAGSSADQASPIGKVIEMISDLEAKLVGEGEEAQKTYEEFAEWCEDTAKDLQFEIKTSKREVASLKATISNEDANILTQTSTIESLAGEIATNTGDLKAATEIRDKEAANFNAVEKDLVETIDMLERAIGIIEKEKGGASMMQLKSATNVAEALSAMVQAQSLSASDGKKLIGLLQQADEDENTGAPDPTVFESSSGGVLGVLNDVLEKAQSQLDDARNKEKADLQNFEMLKQSLTDEIAFGNKEMSEAQKSKSGSEESKATATGDLEVTTTDLNNDFKSLNDLHHECMTKANEFEAETKSRSEELKALATAKKIVIEATSLAQVSLLQKLSLTTSADLRNFEVTRMLHDLAKKHHDTLLSQLASQVNSELRYGSGSKADVFAKIKGLIQDMITRLEEEAEADATEKVFCDKELGETNDKKADKTAELEKISAKIDKMAARSKQLKSEVSELQSELSKLSSSQAEMDKIRSEEKSQFEANKAETEKALTGVKKALKVLNEYYAKADQASHQHGDTDGTGSGIIGVLEQCESDFSKGLAEMIQVESTAARDYDSQTKENEITRTTKEQDAKYKTKEAANLDKSVTEYESDKSGVTTELQAVNEYLAQLEDRCIAKASTYDERKAHREAEIQGLQEALESLDSLTAAFVEVKSHRYLRLRRAK
jgi:chromosome segregation ATPase